MKRTKKTVTPTLSPLAQYNLQRAQEAQMAHGGKGVKNLASTAQFNEHRHRNR